MSLPLVVLRPQPGDAATVAAAQAMGLDVHAFPLFAIKPVPWEPVPPAQIDALLIGSVNALRHGGEALALYRAMPAYAVGEKTAQAAREAGLEVIAVGKGGLQQVLDALHPGHRRLLRLAGRERVELALPPGVAMITREVYASEPLPLPPVLAALLATPAVILLHSGEAAGHFAALCDTAGIARGHLRLAAIGPRVAERAGTGWAALQSANAPSDSALLAMAAQMCKDAPSGSQPPEQG